LDTKTDSNFLFRRTALMGGLVLLAYVIFTGLFGSVPWYATASDISLMVVNGAVSSLLLYAARKARGTDRRLYVAILLLGLAQVAYMLGDLIWIGLQRVQEEPPFPSICDGFYLLYYPLFIAALFCLPTKKLTSSEWTRGMLDLAIIITSVSLISWDYLLYPTITGGQPDWLTLTLSVAYPVLDLVLFFTLFNLLLRRVKGVDSQPLLLLELGVIFVIVGDVIFMRESMLETYVAGDWADKSYMMAYVLTGLVGASLADRFRTRPYTENEVSSDLQSWVIYLPYLWGIAAYLLLINHDSVDGMPFSVLVAAVGLIFCLIILRQVVALRENTQLYQIETQRRYLAEALSRAGQELTSTLEFNELLEHIMQRLSVVVPFERCSIMLQEEQTLQIVAQRGFPVDEKARQVRIEILEDDIYLKIVAERKPLVIPDVTQVPGWRIIPWLPLNKSWMGVPLIVRDRVIGMISMTRRDAAGFDIEEALLSMGFAGQAAVALQNARLYNELTEAYQRLEILDKTKARFIEVAAHELRTPLTVIKGYSQVLSRQPLLKNDPQLTQMLDGILNGTQRMHEIVNSMLDVARIDNQTLELVKVPTHLDFVVRKVVTQFSSALTERRLTLTLDGLEGLPAVQADPEILQKVFSKLVVNAIKYTPDGGAIKITGFKDDVGHAIEVVVSDTGIGIAPDQQAVVFEKLYQSGEVAFHSSGVTSFKGGGPGLGLAIARGFVLAHGGRIWVESSGYDEAVCPGSSFHVRLPL